MWLTARLLTEPHMKACDQTRLWSLHQTLRHCHFSRSSYRAFPFSEVFFQIAQILFLAFQFHCQSCICTVRSASPLCLHSHFHTKRLYSWSWRMKSAPALNRQLSTHILLWGVSSNLFILAYYMPLLLGSYSGQTSSQTSDEEWRRTLPSPVNRIAAPQWTTCSLNYFILDQICTYSMSLGYTATLFP